MNIKYIVTAVIVIILTSMSVMWFFVRKNVEIPIAGDLISGTSPSPSASFSSLPSPIQKGKNIIVSSPKTGDKVGSPFIVKGRARVFENTFIYILRGDNNAELYKNHAMANAPDVGQYGDFEVKIPISPQASKKVTLEVFDYSAKNGSVQDLVSIPLELITQDKMDINVYFTNIKKGPDTTCVKVFPIKRQILKTQEVAYMSLYQLIQGPNMGELSEGYDTGIPGQTVIRSVKIVNGTAYVDFDEGIEYGVSGSCRVTAIKSQIEATLKQFPTIKNVVISIDGRTEDILQP